MKFSPSLLLKILKRPNKIIGLILVLGTVLFDKFGPLFVGDIIFSILISLGIFLIFKKYIQIFIFSIFGTFSYQKPNWLSITKSKAMIEKIHSKITNKVKHREPISTKSKKIIFFSTILIALIAASVNWYINREVPLIQYTTPTLSSPSSTQFWIGDAGVIERAVSDLRISFDEEVAPLEKIGKEVVIGIELRPKIIGKWKWETAKTLVFTPKNDWFLGQEIGVEFKSSLISPQFTLKENRLKFSIPALTLSSSSKEFYEDPRDPTKHNAIYEFKFNYPVDLKSLKEKLKAQLITYQKTNKVLNKKQLSFKILNNETEDIIYIHTENVGIPKREAHIDLSFNGKIKSKHFDHYTDVKKLESVRIPGVTQYFYIKSSKINIIENKKGLPEQILIVESSTGILPRELQKKINIRLMPIYKDKKVTYPTKWNNVHDKRLIKLGLENSEIVDFTPIGTVEQFPKIHMFKIETTPSRYLNINIGEGTISASKLALPNSYTSFENIPKYPKKVNFIGEGSVLRLRGDKKISLMTYNVKKVEIKIGQVLKGQVQHLISMTSNTSSKPDFHQYNFNEYNLSHFEVEEREVAGDIKSEANYEVIDFQNYIERNIKGAKARGLFFINAKSTKNSGVKASKFILITDLGIILKKDINNVSKIFVQSLETGEPIAGAEVQVVSKNGLALYTKITNSSGTVTFPKFNGNYYNTGENPIGYIVKKGSDLSFIKLNDYSRLLNYSRFNIGGVRESTDSGKLKGYLFSDRGMYRPGEEVHIGHIIKTSDWEQSLEDLPIEIEVRNPKNKKIAFEKQSIRKSGFGDFNFQTSRSSVTGPYRVSIFSIKTKSYKDARGRSKQRIRRNLIGSTEIKVQEFKPDKLKIRISLNPKKSFGWVKPTEITAAVNLKSLFGNASVDHKIRTKYIIRPVALNFPQHKDYYFDNPTKNLEEYESAWMESKSNDKGEVVEKIDLDKFQKKVFRLSVVSEGYEKDSGRSVIANDSMIVSPHDYLIGVKEDGGSYDYIKSEDKRDIKFLAIDSSLKPKSVDKLSLKLSKYNYVNVLTKRSNGSYYYQSLPKEITISQTPFSLKSIGFNYRIETKESGDFRISILNEEGLTLSDKKFTIVGERNLSRSLNRNAELQVKLNKSDYENGEYIEMEIRSPYLGSGLITIERDRIYAYQWFKMDKQTKIIKVKVPKGLEGNAFININLSRGKKSKEIYMSPFSYGAFGFTVSRKKRQKIIDLGFLPIAKPGEKYSITYKTEHPADIILYAVNEGILQFAKYKNPAPLGYFLNKKQLGVNTWQILDLIMPENSIIEKTYAAGGGAFGEAAKHLNPFSRKLKKPIAFWSGVLQSDKKTKEWSFHIPGYFNGQLRILAVAVNKKRIGTNFKKSFIKADIIISPTAPTYAAPGDTFTLPVSTINNIEGSGEKTAINVILKTSKNLKIMSTAEVNLKINENKEQSSKFEIKVNRPLGNADLKLSARSGKTINFIDETLSIRPSSPYQSSAKFGSITDTSVEISKVFELYKEKSVYEISLAPTPLSFSKGLERFLQSSPYGCSEQITSKAMAHLFHKDLNIKETKRSQDYVNKTIAILTSRQVGSGEILLYPDYRNTNPFISIYVMHFLIEAIDYGHYVPVAVIKNIAEFLKSNFSSIRTTHDKAYAVYLMTRFGEITTPFLNKIEKEIKKLKGSSYDAGLANAYLSGSFQLLKNTKKALSYSSKTNIGVVSKFKHYSYYNNLNRDAQILYIAAKHFPESLSEIKEGTIGRIFSKLNKNLNTLSASYSLLALNAYQNHFKKIYIKDKVKVLTEKMVKGKSNWLPFSDYKLDGDTIILPYEHKSVRLVNKGNLPLFYSYVHAGFRKDKIKKSISKIEVIKKVLNEKGSEVTRVKIGEKIKVEITFRTTEPITITDGVLVDLFPGGFEYVHDKDFAEKAESYTPQFINKREDRIIAYSNVTNSISKFSYYLKATNLGKFALPATLVEDMYFLESKGLSNEKILEVYGD